MYTVDYTIMAGVGDEPLARGEDTVEASSVSAAKTQVRAHVDLSPFMQAAPYVVIDEVHKLA